MEEHNEERALKIIMDFVRRHENHKLFARYDIYHAKCVECNLTLKVVSNSDGTISGHVEILNLIRKRG